MAERFAAAGVHFQAEGPSANSYNESVIPREGQENNKEQEASGEDQTQRQGREEVISIFESRVGTR